MFLALARSDNALRSLLANDQLDKELEGLTQWIEKHLKLRAIMRAGAGVVTEIFLQGGDFKHKGDWLSVANESFHLHINWSKVTTAYFFSRDNTSYGIHFIDHLGRLVFRLLLTKQEGDFNAEALANFQQNWTQLGEQHD